MSQVLGGMDILMLIDAIAGLDAEALFVDGECVAVIWDYRTPGITYASIKHVNNTLVYDTLAEARQDLENTFGL